MIVELPGTASDYSVGTVKHYKMGFFHFSNNNLSIRKECARDIGMYDPEAVKSEDVEICFRVARSPNWVALRERGNFVRHKGRRTFAEFVKQMWGWGFHVGYPYAKTGIRGIYIYWLSSSDHKMKFDIEIEKFPFLACMFLTDFHVAHVLLGLAALAGIVGHHILMATMAVLALPFLWRYLHDDRHAGLDNRKTCQLAFLHYIANVVFMVATILGALKHGMVLLPSTIFRPTDPDKA